MSDSELAAVVRARSTGGAREFLVAFDLVRSPPLYRRDRIVTVWWSEFRNLRAIRVSPRGRFVSARSQDGAVVFSRRGGVVAPPMIGRAVAWSPDERWIALASESGVSFFRTRAGLQPAIQAPIVARDLVWR